MLKNDIGRVCEPYGHECRRTKNPEGTQTARPLALPQANEAMACRRRHQRAPSAWPDKDLFKQRLGGHDRSQFMTYCGVVE